MNLLAWGGVEARAGVLFEVDVGTKVVVVVLERVEALELARIGVCRGRGRWWMSYACEIVSGCVDWKMSWTGTNPTFYRVVQDFERLLDLVGELVWERVSGEEMVYNVTWRNSS